MGLYILLTQLFTFKCLNDTKTSQWTSMCSGVYTVFICCCCCCCCCWVTVNHNNELRDNNVLRRIEATCIHWLSPNESLCLCELSLTMAGSPGHLLHQVRCFSAVAFITIGLVMTALPMTCILLLVVYRFHWEGSDYCDLQGLQRAPVCQCTISLCGDSVYLLIIY